jgi:hypothetical protein
MTDSMGLLIVAGLVVVAAALVIGFVVRDRRRQRTRAFAEARGWTYSDREKHLEKRWHGAPFGTGGSRRATEVIAGDFHGRPATSFRYQYTVSSGENQSTTYHFHVAALALPVPLPGLRLSPEGFRSSVAKAFGGQDVQFESHAFNEEWRVQADPPQRWAHDIVHPRMMDRLMQPDARGQTIVLQGSDVFVWTSGSRDLATVDPQLELLRGVVDHVPDYVWRDAGHEPA